MSTPLVATALMVPLPMRPRLNSSGLLLAYLLLAIAVIVTNCSEVSNAPKIVDPVERLNHAEGTNATFACFIGSGDLSGLSYEWRKDDVVIDPSSPGGKQRNVRIISAPDNFQSVLRVMDLKPADAGIYSCLARNKYGQDRVYTRLNVKVQLKWIAEPPREFETAAGKPVHVACSADGLPKPTIEWRKVGASDEAALGQELRFSSIRPEDGGVYECRASNGLEKDLVSRIELKVLGK